MCFFRRSDLEVHQQCNDNALVVFTLWRSGRTRWKDTAHYSFKIIKRYNKWHWTAENIDKENLILVKVEWQKKDLHFEKRDFLRVEWKTPAQLSFVEEHSLLLAKKCNVNAMSVNNHLTKESKPRLRAFFFQRFQTAFSFYAVLEALQEQLVTKGGSFKLISCLQSPCWVCVSTGGEARWSTVRWSTLSSIQWSGAPVWCCPNTVDTHRLPTHTPHQWPYKPLVLCLLCLSTASQHGEVNACYPASKHM